MAAKQGPYKSNVTFSINKSSLSETKKSIKNKTRRLRRRKSKLRVLQYLKECRVKKITKELCDTVAVCHITDMNKATALPEIIPEVAKWQNQHQLAYWKSRAVSLEYENRMLHQHLRDAYARNIVNYTHHHSIKNDAMDTDAHKSTTKKNKKKDASCLPPPELPADNCKTDEMLRLYGDTAPKIIGKETAVQLNFDYQIQTDSPAYWPNLPLNL